MMESALLPATSPVMPLCIAPSSEYESLWSETTGSQRICVAILDGPVDLKHPCFDGADLTRNQTTEAWESPDLKERIQRFPRQFRVITEWLGEDPYTTGRFDGKVETGALAAGQSAAVIKEVLPAKEILRALVEETEAALEALTAT